MSKPIKVAVASGKGGTGKTTVTAALADVWPERLIVADMDVEAPNLHLYLAPEIIKTWPVMAQIPEWNSQTCGFCEQCVEICQFGAIRNIAGKVLVFPELCHDCGGCLHVCPTGALQPAQRQSGVIQHGRTQTADFFDARLRVGEPLSPPLIKKLHQHIKALPQTAYADILIDSPPGASCPAIAAAGTADYIVLVTEPTPFGLHDLQKAFETFTSLQRRTGVVINRFVKPYAALETYCKKNKLPVLARLPYDKSAAQAYGKGQTLAGLSQHWHSCFVKLAKEIKSCARYS